MRAVNRPVIAGVAGFLLLPFSSLFPVAGYAQQQIEEIVVSVRKKDESLQDVPLSVSTISDEQITRFGINDTKDVIKYSAGLEFDEGLGAQDQRIVIRGLSPTRGRSNVAILVDGVDFTGEAVQTAGGGVLANQRLLDVQRVEIVKGPQSALYGRSAFAGAIQYVTKDPSLEEYEGSLNVQGGNGSGANNYSISGAFGGPVLESLGLRLNGTYYNEDGYYDNELIDQEVGGQEGYGIALTGLWDEGGVFSARSRVAYSHDEYEPQPQARVATTDIVDINESVAVKNGETPSLIRSSGLGALLNPTGLYADCGPAETGRDGTITNCISTPKTLTTGTMPDADDLDIIQSDNPRNGGRYDGTDVDLLTGTLGLTWDWDAGTLTSSTGGSYLDSDQLFDGQTDALQAGPFTSADGLYSYTLPGCEFRDCSPYKQEIDFENTTKLFSQEIRWASNLDGPFNYTVGANYWKERVKQESNSRTVLSNGGVGTPPSPFPIGWRCNPFSLCTAPPPIETSLPANRFISDVFQLDPSETRRDTRSWSAYGLVEYDLTDTWKISLEARYVDEKLEVSGPDCDVAATFALTGVAGVNTPDGRTICEPTVFRGDSSVGLATAAGALPAGTYTKAVFTNVGTTFDNEFIAPKATLEWSVSDDHLLYASIAKGVKPGGISTITAGAFFDPEQNEFDDEKLWAYELGAKSTFLEGTLILNSAIFYQDYDDKQVGVSRFNTDIQTDVGSIENAGAARSYGLELEGSWLLTDRWTLSAAYAYTKAEYTDFEIETSSANNIARSLAGGGGGCLTVIPSEGVGNPGDDLSESCIVDLSDNDVEDVPEHSFVGDLRYDRDIAGDMSWYSSASFIYRDDRYIDEWNTKKLDSYWLMDFRAGLIKDQWELIFFVDNVFDDDTVKSAVDFGSIPDSGRQGFFPPAPPDGVIVTMPDPRVVGVRANLTF